MKLHSCVVFSSYSDLSDLTLQEQLLRDFPLIPKNHIRSRLLREGGYYAITFFVLEEDQTVDPKPYRQNNQPRTNANNKGKGVARSDPEFDRERAWLLRKLQERRIAKDIEVAAQLNEKEYEDAGAGIECGCCFTDYPFVRSPADTNSLVVLPILYLIGFHGSMP